MSYETDFMLFFEEDYSGKLDGFLNVLRKMLGDKVDIGKATKYGAEVFIKSYFYGVKEYGYMPFILSVGSDEARKTSWLVFSTDVMDDDPESPNQKLFYDIFFASCKELKPVFGTAEPTEQNTDRENTRPCTDQAEYYKNPYLFCIEPPLFGSGDFNPAQFSHDFFHRTDIVAKLAEIEKVMSRSELVAILKKHSEQMVESDDGGIGVFKKSWQAVYPRYFVRKEIRKRGLELEEGLAEKYAEESGVN